MSQEMESPTTTEHQSITDVLGTREGRKYEAHPNQIQATKDRTLLTADVSKQLCAMVASGNDITTAAALLKLKPNTVQRWIRVGAADDAEEPYASFYLDVQQALAAFEARHVNTIHKAGERGDIGASKFILERRFKERWAAKDDTDSGPKNQTNIVLVWPGMAVPAASTSEERAIDVGVIDV